ncbi:hypothetical protein H206_05342 [Candidatus Electrothrix aarhusensis]|uniref:DDE domain-containing protein n=1 Tax=Candidatus Electrothrix aarhusensis TaxID=1859131 RepID=A0A3S3UBP0_9BACT|nr:hypothetical protein H206_05342 [Candidatus Electrothrix aarhusensis]
MVVSVNWGLSPNYQSEHPDTTQNIENTDIHANHVEGFNAALRRMCSAFRRKTNTYAKKVERLQERLNVIWIIHNFVRVHYTTKEVPAVTLGVIEEGLTLEDVLRLRGVNSGTKRNQCLRRRARE